jgi:ribosomal protein L11 methylase PrmA
VRTAKQNARLNGLSKKVEIWRQDVLKFQAESAYDVVTANLYSVLLRQALPQLIKAARKGGFLIFSGILRDQEAAVKECLREKRLELKESRCRGKWIAMLARKRGGARVNRATSPDRPRLSDLPRSCNTI